MALRKSKMKNLGNLTGLAGHVARATAKARAKNTASGYVGKHRGSYSADKDMTGVARNGSEAYGKHTARSIAAIQAGPDQAPSPLHPAQFGRHRSITGRLRSGM
jgi:hypothetical protein